VVCRRPEPSARPEVTVNLLYIALVVLIIIVILILLGVV
jgi:hypothetical protein